VTERKVSEDRATKLYRKKSSTHQDHRLVNTAGKEEEISGSTRTLFDVPPHQDHRLVNTAGKEE